MNNNICLIFARGGSKGRRNKNIKKINGKPLLYYSIHAAKKCSEIKRVFVSTECKKIKKIAIKYGAEIIDRPSRLASDTASEFLAWKHAVNYLEKNLIECEKFVVLPTTSPLRKISDIKMAMSLLKKNNEIIVSATKSTRNPTFNMIKINKNGYCDLAQKSNKLITRRQNTSILYDMTTVVYVTSPHFIKKNNNIFDGKVRSIIIPAERAIDIDNYFDFKIAKLIMEKK